MGECDKLIAARTFKVCTQGETHPRLGEEGETTRHYILRPSHNADSEHGSTKRITLVSTQPATVYVKTGKKVGHHSKKDEIAKNNTKITQFFALIAPAMRA